MDVKVYKKEEVYQPSGTAMVLTPDVIDIIPEIIESEDTNDNSTSTEEQLVSCEILEDDSHDLLEQECALATIWQRGLDPLEPEDGIQWSEVLLGEVNIIQLMEQIIDAVSKVSLHVKVDFSTVTTDSGQPVLSYSLKEIA
jgi:hypothetical protein